jgi:3-dehydrosphinganine reductase
MSADFFANRTALITGGSSGIGRACALALAKRGAHVFILARRGPPLEKTVLELRTAARAPEQDIAGFRADVRHYSALKKIGRQLARRGRPVDLLINAAGFAAPGYFEKLPIGQFHRQMETNYYGAVHAARAVLPDMLTRGSGTIVNVSSIAGFLGVFGYSAYAPAKFALKGWSDVLRQELTPRGVRIHVVCPPDVDTPGFQREARDKPYETAQLSQTAKLMTPDVVAERMLHGVERGRYLILPNFEARLMHWLQRVAPETSHHIIMALIRRAQARRKLQSLLK